MKIPHVRTASISIVVHWSHPVNGLQRVIQKQKTQKLFVNDKSNGFLSMMNRMVAFSMYLTTRVHSL